MPDTAPKVKKPTKTKTKKSKPKIKKTKRRTPNKWPQISREIEGFAKCNPEIFKIIKKDKCSYLLIKRVLTEEIHKNDNYIHQPYRRDIIAPQFKCFILVDGYSKKGDSLTKEYFEDFGVPVFPVIMVEEVKHKLADFK